MLCYIAVFQFYALYQLCFFLWDTLYLSKRREWDKLSHNLFPFHFLPALYYEEDYRIREIEIERERERERERLKRETEREREREDYRRQSMERYKHINLNHFFITTDLLSHSLSLILTLSLSYAYMKYDIIFVLYNRCH